MALLLLVSAAKAAEVQAAEVKAVEPSADAKTVKFDHPGKRWDLAFGKTAQNQRRGGRHTERRG